MNTNRSLTGAISSAFLGVVGLFCSSAQASSLSTLYSFTTSANASPLTEVGGLFFGTSDSNGGTVFSVSSAGQYNLIYSFPGVVPDGALTLGSDGNLYGATTEGGSDGGTIFRVTPQGAESTIFQFDPLKYSGPLFYPRNRTGGCPCNSPILATDGNVYGTTVLGGPKAEGGIYRVMPNGQEDVLLFFNGKNGQGAYGTLVDGGNSELYGTTSGGGKNNEGTIYQISLSGQFKTLYSFPSASNLMAEVGAGPSTGLTMGSDGYLYGVTSVGGVNGSGTFFKISIEGDLTSIASLPSGTYFSVPSLGADGNFYATSRRSGANGTGQIFRISPTGTISLLYTFSANPASNLDGSYPNSLALGADGNFYGTTTSGGASGWGTVFKFIP